VNELYRLLQALGYETRFEANWVVGERHAGGVSYRVFLNQAGEARLEKRRLEAETVASERLAGVSGQRLCRREVVEIFIAREVQDPSALIAAWEKDG